ncbi:MAG: hypothetical protein ACFB11_12740 [Paracoccaceae bacterium]
MSSRVNQAYPAHAQARLILPEDTALPKPVLPIPLPFLYGALYLKALACPVGCLLYLVAPRFVVSCVSMTESVLLTEKMSSQGLDSQFFQHIAYLSLKGPS